MTKVKITNLKRLCVDDAVQVKQNIYLSKKGDYREHIEYNNASRSYEITFNENRKIGKTRFEFSEEEILQLAAEIANFTLVMNRQVENIK